MGRGEPCEPKGAEEGKGPPNRLGPQIALESVHVIDAGKTALVEGLRVAPWERGKGVAGLLQRFCSQLVKQQHPGVEVARLTRDDQLGAWELKKYRLITTQVRRTRGLGVLPQVQPVTGFLCLPALPTGGALEPCPGTPSPYPGPFAKGKSNSSRLPAVKPSVLRETKEPRSLDFRDPASPTPILSPFRVPNI